MKKYAFLLLIFFAPISFLFAQEHCEEMRQQVMAAYKERNKNTDSALRQIDEIIAQGFLDCETIEALAYVAKGNILIQKGKYGAARDTLKKGLALRETLKDTGGVVAVLNNLSTLELSVDNETEALNYSTKAIRLAKKIADVKRLGRAYNDYANIYIKRQSYQEAIQIYQDALAAYEKNRSQANYSIDIADVQYNLGTAYFYTGAYNTSKKYFKQALATYQKEEDVSSTAQIKNALGELFIVQGATTNALQAFKESIQLSKSSHNPLLEFDAVLNLAKLHLQENNIQQSRKQVSRIEQLIALNPTWKEEKRAYKLLLFDILTSEKKHKEAAKILKEAYEISDLLNAEAEKEAFAQAKAQTNFERQQIAMKEMELWNKNLLAGLLTSISFLLLYMVWSRVQKLKVVQLTTQNAWQVIGRELHEVLANDALFVKNELKSFLDKQHRSTDRPIEEPRILKEHIDKLYIKTRNLSHEVLENKAWFIFLKRKIRHLNNKENVIAELYEFDSDEVPENIGQEVGKIVSELLSNIEKHAVIAGKPLEVCVDITIDKQKLNILVEDNGAGFDVAKEKKGKGLKNIENRVTNLGGTSTIDSKPNIGTWIMITIPFKHANFWHKVTSYFTNSLLF